MKTARNFNKEVAHRHNNKSKAFELVLRGQP